MKTIQSKSGNKEAKITYSVTNSFIVRVCQKSESGLYDELITMKTGYNTLNAAEKFARKELGL